jgi:hypothetical protein
MADMHDKFAALERQHHAAFFLTHELCQLPHDTYLKP